MNGVDRKELNEATIVTYAVMRSLLDELPDVSRQKVIERASTYLPPKPNGDLPVDLQMWLSAKEKLRTLGVLPSKP